MKYYAVIVFPAPLGLESEHQEGQAANLIGMVHALQQMGIVETNAPMPTEVRVGVKGSDDPSFEFASYFIATLHEQFGGEATAVNVNDDGSRFECYRVEREER